MSTRGRSSRRGRGNVYLRQLRRVERNLGPIPTAVIPPIEPPTVRSNKPITAWLDVGPNPDASGIYNYHNDTMGKSISGALGIQEPNYLILEAHAWGDTSGGHYIKMIDYSTSVQSIDEGSFASRPRVGLFYPKGAQVAHIHGEPQVVLFSVIVPVRETGPYEVSVRVKVHAWEKTVDPPKNMFNCNHDPLHTSIVEIP